MILSNSIFHLLKGDYDPRTSLEDAELAIGADFAAGRRTASTAVAGLR